MGLRALKLSALAATAFGITFAITRLAHTVPPAPPGMVLIPAGEFLMGSGRDLPFNEQPQHAVRLDAFYMDEREVSNAQFQEFADASGYLTTAERPVDWEQMKKTLPPGTEKPPPEKLAPGSVVFTPPSKPVPLSNPNAW